MTAGHDLIRRYFDAIGREDVEAAMACIHPEADILDQVEGGRLRGSAQIRAYLLRAFEMIRSDNSVADFTKDAHGDVEVTVNHHVTSRDGNLWHDGPQSYRVSFRDGLIVRLDRLEGP